MSEKSCPVKKTDIIIGAAVIAIGAALVFVYFMTARPGKSVIVSIDGREIASFRLTETVDVRIADGKVTDWGTEGQEENREESASPETSETSGYNRLIIRDGEAWLSSADCPDRLCVKQGRISHTNESIVCLPHRVTIRITGEDEPDDEKAPDAVTGDRMDWALQTAAIMQYPEVRL